MNMKIDELMEKFLLLENVDFELSTNEKIVTGMVDHQDKLDDQTAYNNDNEWYLPRKLHSPESGFQGGSASDLIGIN